VSTFHGGIADGKSVSLHRAPILLRVVIGAHGEVDALDQPEDTPKLSESVQLYQLTREPTVMHICCRPRSASGWYADGDYRLCPLQPDQATLRDNVAFFSWCDERKELLTPKWAKEKTK
jgi:hypothetical protein